MNFLMAMLICNSVQCWIPGQTFETVEACRVAPVAGPAPPWAGKKCKQRKVYSGRIRSESRENYRNIKLNKA